MAKYFGEIGYGISTETKPGVWTDVITKRDYCGDLLENLRDLQSSEQLNDDVNINNQISIVSDPFANENFHAMRYIVFLGAKWKILKVRVLYPRLILTLGGAYHGK